jgi:transposase-like protein
MCPFCHSKSQANRNGFYLRPSDQKRIQQYKCVDCKRSFSATHFSIDYRLRKRRVNQEVFKLLSSGVSQRRCAFLVGVKPIAIARRVDRFGRCAENNLSVYRESRGKVETVLIDEMESFEHTKCKPLTIPIAVEDKSRKILSLGVGKIAAKGHLAAISRRKYGLRLCERSKTLAKVFQELKACVAEDALFKSDESHHYPRPIQTHFPKARHISYKGRRSAPIGQGELKRGGWDPLFFLNHTYAMCRDNLKTLTRRTWCTAKRPDRLESLLYIYAYFHNLWLDRKNNEPKIVWLARSN